MDVDYQLAVSATEQRDVPSSAQVQRWFAAAADGRARPDAVVTVRIVGIEEMTDLNQTYRQKAGPTNVLSFPFEAPAEVDEPLLGDIVICATVVRDEARRQHKTPEAHWAHMVVHGGLHLLGYDHIDEEQANEMEALETAILADLGFPNPYRETGNI